MTFFEHAMMGGTLAFAAGLHRRHGPRIAIMAGVAAMLPDWDGVPLLFGPAAYDLAHRIWGHNLLIATLLGGIVGIAECSWNVTDRIRRRLVPIAPPIAAASSPTSANGDNRSIGRFATWFATGAGASLSHLAIDLFYSSHPRMQDWPLRLLWPFSPREFALPTVQWGDIGATIIFVIEMFALYRWPARAQSIACLALAGVCLYVTIRAIGG